MSDKPRFGIEKRHNFGSGWAVIRKDVDEVDECIAYPLDERTARELAAAREMAEIIDDVQEYLNYECNCVLEGSKWVKTCPGCDMYKRIAALLARLECKGNHND